MRKLPFQRAILHAIFPLFLCSSRLSSQLQALVSLGIPALKYRCLTMISHSFSQKIPKDFPAHKNHAKLTKTKSERRNSPETLYMRIKLRLRTLKTSFPDGFDQGKLKHRH